MNKYLISVIGPTAIGKTLLGIQLAEYFNTEIISADSRQFYKEMKLGTAVPSKEELKRINHYFIQHISIKDNYNVGSFEKDAIACLNRLFQNHDVVIMVGGSGLYIDAVIKGLDSFPKVDAKIRKELNYKLLNDGLESLQKDLQELDPKAYSAIAIDNPQRVIRALEICLGTSKPYSSFLNKKNKKRSFETITIGLTADRPDIYTKINQRVDHMIQEGLLDEVRALDSDKHLNALNTVGYKELFKYLNGTWSLEFAISEIKKNTRRFAKRQLTWFRKNEDIVWFNNNIDVQNIIDVIEDQIKKPA